MGKEYPISFEVQGHAAMFTRPDAGSAPVSYPAPTFSAVKGMFESVVRMQSAYIKPVRVEICRPIVYHRYFNNYGGPLRKANTRNFQLAATILVDVCYKVYGIVEEIGKAPYGNNHCHALQEIFIRRLKQGSFYYTPCLGWKEFVPTYFSLLRDSTTVDKSINMVIPSMLYSMFDKPGNGNIQPLFKQNVEIVEGVLNYD
ncbi:MAG: CRISPR-associated protein Cas5 [Prolixibacteraceae bacterium]|jgi:CRISPR-associated protein Cas5d|nr:CRISPR-associated protein Cas5 [Prolixibacteraceae bacterium]